MEEIEMKISKILAGISAMAVAATMALSASAATTISVNNPDVGEWSPAFPKWTDGTQTMDDYIDGKGRRALDSYLQFGYIPLEDEVQHEVQQLRPEVKRSETAKEVTLKPGLSY